MMTVESMLGFFVIGWPTKRYDLGPVYPGPCPDCGHDADHHFIKKQTWLELFLLRIVPLGDPSFALQCAACGREADLDGQQIEQAKVVQETYLDYQRGEASRAEFRAAVEDLWTADVDSDGGSTSPGVETRAEGAFAP